MSNDNSRKNNKGVKNVGKQASMGILTASIIMSNVIVPMANYTSYRNVLAKEAVVEAVVKELENQGVKVKLGKEKQAELMLTLGSAGLGEEYRNFKGDLEKELADRGFDIERIKITALETSEADVTDEFSWVQYSHSYTDGAYKGHKFADGRTTKDHIVPEGDDLYFYGNYKKPEKDFLYMANNNAGIKEFKLGIDEAVTDYHTLEGAGFLFNTEINEAGKMSGYVMLYLKEDMTIFELKNVDAKKLSDGTPATIASVGKKIHSVKKKGTKHDLKITATPEYITIEDNGVVVVDKLELENHHGNGFGPIASYTSHNCSSLSHIVFKDIKMETVEVHSFRDVIYQPSWGDNTEKFIVNLNTDNEKDMDNQSVYSEVITKILNDDLHYIGLGTDKNKEENEGIVDQVGKGTVVDNGDYDKALKEIADYIIGVMGLEEIETDGVYLVNDTVHLKVNPEELLKSSKNAEYPDGRWRVEHDYKYFENNEGQADFSGQVQDGLKIDIERPGKYDIYFEDELIESIISHREPTASYTADIIDGELKIVEDSYDIDNMTDENRGIKEKHWKWRAIDDEEWVEGEPPIELPEDKDYVIQLVVEDSYGVKSKPLTKYVSTREISTAPITEFYIKKPVITKYEKLDVVDSSYDPVGEEITEKEWVLKKNGKEVYKGSDLPLEYAEEDDLGDYVISLRVKNAKEEWSKPLIKRFRVTKDTQAPSITVDKGSQSWTPEAIEVNIGVTDEGGSALKGTSITVTGSKEAPEERAEMVEDTDIKVDLTEDGVHYIHIKSEDNEGNILERVLGPYQIDSKRPEIEYTVSSTEPDHRGSITIMVEAEDGTSGVDYIKLPNGEKQVGKEVNYPVTENGVYEFTAVDRAGNETTVDVEIDNINNEIPKVTHKLSTNKWTNRDVEIELDLSDKYITKVTLPDGTTKYKLVEKEDKPVVDEDKDDEDLGTDNEDDGDLGTEDKDDEDLGSDNEDEDKENEGSDKEDEDLGSEDKEDGKENEGLEDGDETNTEDDGEKPVEGEDDENLGEGGDDNGETGQDGAGTEGKDEDEGTDIPGEGTEEEDKEEPGYEDTKEYFENEINLSVDENGEYTFIIEDDLGREIEYTVTVGNIDKEAPTGVVEVGNNACAIGPTLDTAINLDLEDNLSGIAKITVTEVNRITGERQIKEIEINPDQETGDLDYAVDLEWVLTEGDGLRGIIVEVEDKAGNKETIETQTKVTGYEAQKQLEEENKRIEEEQKKKDEELKQKEEELKKKEEELQKEKDKLENDRDRDRDRDRRERDRDRRERERKDKEKEKSRQEVRDKEFRNEVKQKLDKSIPYTVLKGSKPDWNKVLKIDKKDMKVKKMDTSKPGVTEIVIDLKGQEIRYKVEVVELEESQEAINKIPTKHWASNFAKEAINKGYIKGMVGGDLALENRLTVAESFTAFDRVLLAHDIVEMNIERPAVESRVSVGNSWYSYPVKSILSKYAEKTMITSDDYTRVITREEIAQVIANSLKGRVPETKNMVYYTDDSQMTNKEAIDFCTRAGIMEGMPDGSFQPKKGLTRAEYMTVLARVDEKLR